MHSLFPVGDLALRRQRLILLTTSTEFHIFGARTFQSLINAD